MEIFLILKANIFFFKSEFGLKAFFQLPPNNSEKSNVN